MRTYYALGTSFILHATSALAQPTLDLSNNRPADGEEFPVRTRTGWAWEGPSGADENFAFYDLFATGNRNYYALPASVTSTSASIPAANMVTTDGGGDTLFWNYTDNGLYQVGARTSLELTANYTDPVLELPYPCTFGTTWNDITVATYPSPAGTATRTGTIAGSADAYGELGIPGVFEPNILRVKVRRDFNDATAPPLVITSRRITNTYYFFREATAWPLLKLVVDSVSLNGGGYTVSRDAQWMGTEGGVGLGEVDLDQVAFNPYPNPTTGRVDLGLGQDQLRSLEVYTATGQLVATEVKPITGTFSSVLDLSGLPSGVYHLKVTNIEGRTGSRRVMVE